LRLRTLLQNLGRTAADSYRHDMARLRPERCAELIEGDVTSAGRSYSARWFEGLFADADAAGASDPLSRVLYVDTKSFLAEGVLVKVDRASMAHGLEVRSPLLDHRIYELAARLPASSKVHRMETKRVMRQALLRHLPPQIAERPKQGFDPPRAAWLRGALRPMVEEALDSQRSGLTGLIRRGEARRLWSRFLAGGPDESPLFWTLLCFDLWSRGESSKPAVIDEPASAPPSRAAGGN
jgi:asparagine synthase (glutamine-hydrolysing)